MPDLINHTVLDLIDAFGNAKLHAGLADGSEPTYDHEADQLRNEIKRRLAEVYAQGSLGGRIRSLIGDDIRED